MPTPADVLHALLGAMVEIGAGSRAEADGSLPADTQHRIGQLSLLAREPHLSRLTQELSASEHAEGALRFADEWLHYLEHGEGPETFAEPWEDEKRDEGGKWTKGGGGGQGPKKADNKRMKKAKKPLADAEEIEDAATGVDPNKIKPPHHVKDEDFFERLVASMREKGWQGRPILAVETGDEEYDGWTGSHRLAAAQEAELEDIPTVVVTWDELTEAAEAQDRDPFWALENLRDDDDKLAFLKAGGLNVAAELMRQEIEKADDPSDRHRKNDDA